jgi:CheY-like chemotaxis protein
MSDSKNFPDFIFLDSHLSGIDGRECLRKIKAEKNLEAIPVVIFSGYVSEEEKLKYKELGALECISKAHSLTDLQNKLNGFFSKNYRLQA